MKYQKIIKNQILQGPMACQSSFADCGMTTYQRWKQAEYIEDSARNAREAGEVIREAKKFYQDLKRQ